MLELLSVTKRFGDRTAVDGLNITLRSGEFFALLGPNAAGKTTTVKMIAGLLRPSSGSIRIAGHDVAHEAIRAKSFLGYVPDIPFLYDKLTVDETLDFAACVYGLTGEEGNRAKGEMISMFNLSQARGFLVEQLSHGLRQRLIFAMVMIHKPRLMVVDEPFVGLDPRSVRSVKDALKGCAGSGGAVLMCTHTLSAAEELADRVGIISRGRLIALGTIDELRGRAGHLEKLEEVFLRITEEAQD
ncbi:MAG: ABC transporter ATP-binding protein [Candidatus Aureabacteria bacterium]|jgi:ABC-2 type transport system ATP-binding protein|nr:ABC transporter ATP-binding protein [Candidatus Auribacterota bacterium]